MTTPYNPYGNDGQNDGATGGDNSASANNSYGQPNQSPYGGGSSYDQTAGNAYGAAGGYPMNSGTNQPAGERPQNYLVWAILSTVLCCLPTGIASIIFATQVNSKWDMGDFAGAQESSRKARLWAIIGAVLGLVGTIIYVIVVAATGALSATGSSY